METRTKAERFIATLKEMNRLVLEDIKSGFPWWYSNTSKYKHAKTFPAARKKRELRNACCTSAPQWALLLAGLVDASRDGIQWYGGKGGPVWIGKDAKKNAKKYFKLIKVNKTVKKAIADGTMKAGDICTYAALSHTNVYLGDGKSCDSGHANCSGSGEGAMFKRWIGPTPYQGYKLAYILRLKEDTYRVQIGAYSDLANVEKAKKKIWDALKLETFEEASEIAGLVCVYCGAFEDPDRAKERLALVQTVDDFKRSFIKKM